MVRTCLFRYWPRSRMDILLEKGWKENPLKGAHPELDAKRGAHLMVSTDQGTTWEFRGMVKYPSPSFDEHLTIEKKDGSWWMTARTGVGHLDRARKISGACQFTPFYFTT